MPLSLRSCEWCVCVHVCVYLTLQQVSALVEGMSSSRAAFSHHFPLKEAQRWPSFKQACFFQPFCVLLCS